MAPTAQAQPAKSEQHYECAARRFLYVWEGPIRIIHWINFFCIIILSFTGYYIHEPFMSSAQHPYMMGTMRYVHYITGIVFTMSIVGRLFWFITGDYYASWRSFPNLFNKKQRDALIAYIRYYTFLGKETPHQLGHNPVAFLAYTVLFGLFFLQILSGFALWSQADPAGTMYSLTGWVFGLVSNQWVRWFHFLVMFLIGGFVINHIYSVVLFDFKSKSGEVSSIFSGWKPDRRD